MWLLVVASFRSGINIHTVLNIISASLQSPSLPSSDLCCNCLRLRRCCFFPRVGKSAKGSLAWRADLPATCCLAGAGADRKMCLILLDRHYYYALLPIVVLVFATAKCNNPGATCSRYPTYNIRHITDQGNNYRNHASPRDRQVIRRKALSQDQN